jgi:hypothetical protein
MAMNEDTMGLLAKALATAQGEIKTAKKDAANPFYKSKYATLAGIWDVCREPLSKNGLAVTQPTEITDGGVVVLITRLLHSGGGEISSRYPVVPVKNDPQGYGSAMTYARRYCLASIVGVAADDDDGEGAGHAPTEGPRKEAHSAPKPAPAQSGRVRVASDADMVDPKALGMELERLAGDRAGARVLLSELRPGLDSLKGLGSEDVRGLWESLLNHPKYGLTEDEHIKRDVDQIFADPKTEGDSK